MKMTHEDFAPRHLLKRMRMKMPDMAAENRAGWIQYLQESDTLTGKTPPLEQKRAPTSISLQENTQADPLKTNLHHVHARPPTTLPLNQHEPTLTAALHQVRNRLRENSSNFYFTLPI